MKKDSITSSIIFNKKNGRNINIDLVKGLCILFVFIGHSGIVTHNYRVIWTSFFMSSFVFFSGYLFKYKENTNLTIIHKTKRLLIVYLLWTIIPFFILSLHSMIGLKKIPSDFTNILLKIIIGIDQPSYLGQMWFLYALYVIELIYILIDNVFKNKKLKVFVIILLAVFGILLNKFGYKLLACRIDTALIMLPIFYFGIIMRHTTNECVKSIMNMKIKEYIPLIIVYLSLVYINGILSDFSISIWAGIYGVFLLFYINAFLGTILTYNIFNSLNSLKCKLCKIINSIFLFFGSNSTTCLITMNLVIYTFGKFIDKLDIFITISEDLKPFLIFILSTLIQIPIAWALKNKYLKWLKGEF